MSTGVNLQNIAFSYGDLSVIKGLTTELILGELISIVGPNGAGKTTLIKILVGAKSYYSGDITFFGQPFHSQDMKLKQLRKCISWGVILLK